MRHLNESPRRILASVPGLEVAILFGSQASRTAGRESDVDLALLLDAPMSPEQKRNIIESIAAEVGSPVDVVDLYSAPEPILGSPPGSKAPR
jgi:predicted nucleotidyltransferase